MNGIAHLMVGAAVGVAITPLPEWHALTIQRPEAALAPAAIVLASIVGALLPDIDHRNSTISRKPIMGAVGAILRLGVSHRGITHSLLALALVGIVGTLAHEQVGVALALGYASHLALDMLTPSGVPLYAPLSWRMVKIAHKAILGAIKGVLQRALIISAGVYLLVKFWEWVR